MENGAPTETKPTDMLGSSLHEARVQIARRIRQFSYLVKTEGLTGFTDRLRTYLARRLAPANEIWPVRRADVVMADFTSPVEWRAPDLSAGQQTIVNWVMIPPSRGSGGHTTIFRAIHYLQGHGYDNRIYLYDPYGGDHRYYETIIRNYYGFHGAVKRVDDGLDDAHAVVATSWPTAYAVYNAGCAGKRYYFVQDFEPYFYAVSSFGVLAENTYRMGFHGITAGRWLSEKLASEYNMRADYFEFGCDTSVYNLKPGSKRNGIAFYCRPDASRRGAELALMAIEKFASRWPKIDLHFYGAEAGKLPYRIVNHGLVTPQRLNEIYNQCICGLSLSLTNVSLVPHEMLAAGCIPVVNDAEHTRIVLQNDYVRYVPLNPHAIASEFESLVTMPDFEALSKAAAASVRSLSWTAAGAKIDAIFRETLA